jgi:squid-like protein
MKELLKSPKQTLGGKDVDVKKATPRADAPGGPGNFPRGGAGGRGGPRGGPRGGMRGMHELHIFCLTSEAHVYET